MAIALHVEKIVNIHNLIRTEEMWKKFGLIKPFFVFQTLIYTFKRFGRAAGDQDTG